ncbi:hypothetical protein MBLNU459_g5404t1 [Dothideomycetes sp. NU459]
MTVFPLAIALLAGAASAAPKSQFPHYDSTDHPDHPGYSKPTVYYPPQPNPSWYRPYPIASSSPSSSLSLSNATATATATTTGNTDSTSVVVSASASGSSTVAACASVSELVASFTSASPSATPTVPAAIAYECLNSIPFNQSAASDLLESIRPYLNWQTTLEYVKSPPVDYAEKIQAPYDFLATFNAIAANVSAGSYASEYAFGFDLYRSFQRVHDGHFGFTPDSVGLIFNFARTTPLVSVSVDGKSVPQPYVYADILTASFGNATFTPSPITQIDGQNATEFLLNWSQYGSLQDKDALWNNMFWIPAQVSLGSTGTGTGTFSGGGRGRFPYPGASTTLTFANGTSVTNQNYAKVLASFDGITSGADIYQTYFAVPEIAFANALELATATTSSASSTAAASSTSAASPTTATSTPAPGYPTPVIRQSNNLNGGYFLDGAGFEDVAVLTVPSFVGLGSAEVEFQNVNSQFIADALAANKTKLIIDVSANAGGTILQGYDLFKQLFPSILPYGATRFRAHEALDLIGQEFSYISGLYPRSLSENDTIQNIESAAYNYRTDADINYEPFNSWAEKYGPHAYGPAPDNFTSIIRWNLSDVLTPDNSGGIYVSGYLNRSNVTVQPFARDNIIIVYDGYCASTCTIFSELMRQQAGVKTIALGGRPNTDIIQAVGGVKGTNDYPYDYILESVETVFQFGNDSQRDYWNTTALGTYIQLPLYRSSASPVVNARDGIRQGDVAETPLQFVYEPADCRIFYTPAMVVDETAVWKTVADTVWNGADACVAGSNAFYANATTKRSVQPKSKKHAVRRDVDVSELWNGLGVSTGSSGGITLGGDAIMLP